MRIYLLGAGLIVLAVWGYVHSRRLSDGAIADFYALDAKSTVDLDADASCALVADDFQGTSISTIRGEAVKQDLNKAKFCEDMHRAVAILRQAAQAAHTEPNVNYSNQQNRVVFTPDHRGATIDMTYQLDIGRMHVSGQRTDKLVKRDGKVFLLGQDDRSEVSLVMR